MKEEHNKIDRRNFLRTVGAAGLGSVLAGCESKKESEPDAVDVDADADAPATEQEPLHYTHVPKRKLGKTGIEVPSLCLGGNHDICLLCFNSNQLQTAIIVMLTYRPLRRLGCLSANAAGSELLQACNQYLAACL